MNMSMLAGMISLMTKAGSGVESALMSVNGNAAIQISSSLCKLLLFMAFLSCVVDGAGLTDNRDLYLTWIGHLILDLLCNLS